MESTATGGTQNDDFPTEINPSEDGALMSAMALQDTDVTIDRDGSNNMTFTDGFNTGVTLSQLLSGSELNVDGGRADSIYVAAQVIDGGDST